MLSAIEYRYQPSDSVHKEPFCQPGQKYSLKSNHIHIYIFICFPQGILLCKKKLHTHLRQQALLGKVPNLCSRQFNAVHRSGQASNSCNSTTKSASFNIGTLQIVSTSFLIYSTGTRNILQNPLRNRMILQCMFIILWFLMACAYTDTMCMLCIRSYISIWLCIFTGVWGVCMSDNKYARVGVDPPVQDCTGILVRIVQ